jgi:hypothetical protein
MKRGQAKPIAPVNYRITVLRTLIKAMKETKSFMQQKTATKMKRASLKLKSDPTDQKAQKSFRKFEKKLQFIKNIHSPETRAAAFLYSKFDFEINFDSVKDKVIEMIETDPEELILNVFRQLKDESIQKEAYLLFYQLLKEKPQKRFTDAVQNLRTFADRIENTKESKKIRKRSQVKRKLEKKTKAGEDADEIEDVEEELGDVPDHKVEYRNSVNHQPELKFDPKAPNTFHKQNNYITKKRDTNRRDNAQGGYQRVFRGRGTPEATQNAPEDGGFHPSFKAKIEKRRQQKAVPFGGEIVDL